MCLIRQVITDITREKFNLGSGILKQEQSTGENGQVRQEGK